MLKALTSYRNSVRTPVRPRPGVTPRNRSKPR